MGISPSHPKGKSSKRACLACRALLELENNSHESEVNIAYLKWLDIVGTP